MPYKCKQKQKEAQAKHYQENKDSYRKARRDTRQRRRDFVKSQMRPCDDCGIYHPAIMDWHHREPEHKVGAICTLIKNSNMETIIDELQKCDCLCSNCHRLRHYGASLVFDGVSESD